ncbi:MAG: type I methionyl aminopeptidase [Thermoleophilia bacterium]
MLKTPGEIEAMAAAGALLAACHDAVAAEVGVGVTTQRLDELVEGMIREAGGVPAFLGYPGPTPFPASICASINDEVVHGFPRPTPLRDGDVFSCDIGVVLDGWVADGARTHGIGAVSPIAARLIETTRVALERGVAAARPGNRLGDIGHAVQREVEAQGFSVVQSLVGHGVGRSMHEDPQVPNLGRPGTGLELEEGLVIAIEPMVNIGAHDVILGDDGWTIATRDGSLSAHWEHTVAVTADGPRILTQAAA